MRILTVCSDKNYSNFLNRKLTGLFEGCAVCINLEEALTEVKQSVYEVVICCLPLDSKICPRHVLQTIKGASPKSEVIVIAENLQLHQAMELMRNGAYNCYNRPFPFEQLEVILQRLKANATATSPKQAQTQSIKEREPYIFHKNYVRGVSNSAQYMYNQIDLVAPTSFSVIIYGATGTGKEAVAHRIAKTGEMNRKSAYIPVDCGCLSKELALSELFGHEKGSFTGAVAQKVGAFELANGGTLFLDEIGNLDYEVQGYLLRAIQERKIRRLGGTAAININTRIIVASNENLAEAVKKGKFREDLYHRLNEFEIVVPPLRSRPDDLPLFIDHFIAGTNIELGKTVKGVAPEALSLMEKYDWPGNIRELRNVIRRACLLTADGNVITVNQLHGAIVKHTEQPDRIAAQTFPLKARDVTVSKIKEVLRMVKYNKSKAADLLGIDRKTLYNKLKALPFVDGLSLQ